MKRSPAMADAVVLIEPLIPSLRRYAYVLLRDQTSADDLVQDALERAISRWGQRRSDRDTRSWLFAIVHNLAANHLRQLARRGVHVSIEDAHEDTFAAQPAQENALLCQDVFKAMQALPEEQRVVLLLVAVEGLSYEEVARVVNAPTGTVMSRLARARDKLFQLIEGFPAEADRQRPHLRRIK